MRKTPINSPEADFSPAYIPKFETPEQFIEEKLAMLGEDFKLTLTDEEINHLSSLKTEVDINAAVRTILNNHWK
jgi:hypothetical protein